MYGTYIATLLGLAQINENHSLTVGMVPVRALSPRLSSIRNFDELIVIGMQPLNLFPCKYKFVSLGSSKIPLDIAPPSEF
jgi:thiamine pyrophosphate-dependent acetolactate synthase large subunit-like protein